MADVFISYAREDREHAQRLAEEIDATGLKVWWDRELVPTEEWDEAIEREIHAASSVIVVWTPTSVVNDNVKEEAHEARNLGKLAPVKIGDCRPPMFFRRHQFQDLTDWRGDGASLEFKTLALQLVANAHGEEAAQALPPLESPEPIRLTPGTSAPSPSENRLGPWINGAVGLSIVLGLIAASRGLELQHVVGAYWAWVITLAIAAVGLFRAAEYALPKGQKALVARWLSGEKTFRSSVAFLRMFEAVFGRRHFSWRCFSRSVVATLAFYLLLLLAFVDVERLATQLSYFDAFNTNFVFAGGGIYTRLEYSAALLLVVIPLANIVTDYISLLQTRKILEWTTGELPLIFGVALDAILTALIFVALLPVGPMIAIILMGSYEIDAFSAEALHAAVDVAPEVWLGLWLIFEGNPIGEIDAVLSREASLTATTLLIACVTTFITSAWLWFALLTAPLFRLMSAGRRKGVGRLGRATGAARRPVLWLGYGAAAIVLIVGAGLREGAVAIQREADPQPYRSCAQCPLMIQIPGGTFAMGSPPSEESRRDAEGPQVDVTLQSFDMGVYEVTFREWDACVADGFCRPVAEDAGWGRGLRPAIYVSVDDIAGDGRTGAHRGFLAWMNDQLSADERASSPYRLPSEAEWEYAARAGSTTRYWWGDAISERQSNFRHRHGSSAFGLGQLFDGLSPVRGQSLPVGAFSANAFGLFDVHGNVREIVADCWNETLEGRPVDGAARRDGDCSRAVTRDGSWDSPGDMLRAASRYSVDRLTLGNGTGFRLARSRVDP